jgi:hypothetical protein
MRGPFATSTAATHQSQLACSAKRMPSFASPSSTLAG